uniref:Uncharacterized protein n=1 Tax=Rhinolophus ferrumequinum TaxID=59479 RepID=A0A671DW98_RHIFE
MLSQPMTNETVVIVTSNRINLSQTENPKSTNQGQDILKKLKAEIKVLGVHSSLAANILSSLSALVGFVLLSVNLATLSPALRMWNAVHDDDLYHAGAGLSCACGCDLVETGSL